MSDLKKFVKKLFASVLTGMTAFSMSFGALLPAVVHAAETCPEVEAGDLIKVPNNSAVYYVNADMERMYFPNADVYFTWYSDFSGVKEIPATCIDNYPSGGGVNFHQGTFLVKSEVSPNVYAVGPNNTKHKLPNETVAAALYGADWAKLVRILPDVFDANYKVGAALTEAKPHEGMLVKTAGDTNVYYVMGGMLKKVDGTIPAILSAHVHVVTQAVFDTVEMADAGDTVTAASLLADPSQEGGATTTPPTTPPPATTGDLTFALAGSTPAASTIPGGAQNVEYLRFNVTGSGQQLDSITFKLAGIGSRTDFSKVYLYEGDTRIGSGLSINTNDEVTFNVNKKISGLVTLSVRADMNTLTTAVAGDRNAFQITSAAMVDTSATVKGTFPIVGNEMLLGSQNIVTLTVTAAGTNVTEKIGQDDVQVGEFDLEASSTDDLWFASIRLENKGTAPASVMSNLMLLHNGDEIAMGEISGDYITFELDEMLKIEEGDTENFDIFADLGIGDDLDTLRLVLDETTDLVAFADDFPESRVRVVNTSLDNSGSGGSTAALTVTLDGGDINVDFEGTNKDVRVDQNNVVFGTFTIVSVAEDLDVDSMEFELIKNAGNPCLEDLRLRDKNGLGSYSFVDTDTCTTATSTNTYTAENLVLLKGVEYEFEVLADVASTATSGSQYHFTWAASGVTGEGIQSDNAISDDMFSSASLTGPTMSVSESTLTVRSKALSTPKVVVNGAKNVLMFRGQFEAGDTSDITLSSLTVEKSNSTSWSGLIDSLKLYVESAPGKGINIEADAPLKVDNTVSSDTAIFNGLKKVIGAGSAKALNFEIYADITNGSTTGTVDVKISSGSATDEDSDTVQLKNSAGVLLTTTALETDRNVQIEPTGSVTLSINTDFTGLRTDKYALAGTTKLLAGRVQVLSQNEGVKIEDLGINVSSTTNSTEADVEASFDSIMAYSCADLTDDCLLGSEDFSFSSFGTSTGGTITMNNIDFETASQVKSYIYLALSVNGDGTVSNGTAIPSTSIKLGLVDSLTTAEGLSSKSDLGAASVTATETTLTKDMKVASVVLSEVKSTFAGGSLVGGNQTIFSFSVTADANGNTDDDGNPLEAVLEELTLQLSTDVGSSTSTANVSNLQLCSVETGSCINVTTVSQLNATTQSSELLVTGTGNDFIDLSATDDASNAFTTDELSVEDGETKEFVLKGTISNVTDKFLQVSIQDLNNDGLKWGYDTNNDGTVETFHGDMRMNEPRPAAYPDVFGGSLD